MNVGLIVEGDGEVQAVPLLVRRIALYLDPELHSVVVKHTVRTPRGKIAKENELKRAVESVARRSGPSAPILVVLDADDDLACELAPRLLRWACEARRDRQISVVAAVREYEAWFLAATKSLAGKRGLPLELESVERPEALRSPKTWLNGRMSEGYSETLDQAALTESMNLEDARRAASFDKLVRDLGRLFDRPVPPRRSIE